MKLALILSILYLASQPFVSLAGKQLAPPLRVKPRATVAAPVAVSPAPLAIEAPKNKIEHYTGEATLEGKLVYREEHTVTFAPDGKVLEAKTEYRDPENKLISVIVSDFAHSVTAPVHTVQDLRRGETYGIRYEGEKIVMYDSEKGEKEQTKVLKPGFADERLVIASQGLHYYMKDRLEELKTKKLPIVILIPGKLDFYNFEMEFLKEKDGILQFEVHIQSRFLRLFAPDLKVHYEPKSKRLVYYSGLSNILDEKGDNQSVVITYKFAE